MNQQPFITLVAQILVANSITSRQRRKCDCGGERIIMIKTQIIKEDSKPVAVILDYKEYLRLKETEALHGKRRINPAPRSP